MKKLIIPLLALGLVAGAAQAQNPLTMELPGCDFTEYGGTITTTVDTLWFTEGQTGISASLAFDGGTAETQDWYTPRLVPVGMSGADVNFEYRRPKKVLLFAQAPFKVKPFYAGTTRALRGGATAQVENTVALQGFAWVDSVAITGAAGPASTRAVKYPCQMMFSFVDSMYVGSVAVADSVKVLIGY